jgi:hypothetical protein
MKSNNVKSPTYSEIAGDYRLWIEYCDLSGLDTEAEFNAMSMDEKVSFLVSCFGPETN